MAIRFTLARTLALTLFAGLATGGLTALYTLDKARLEVAAGEGNGLSFARFSGNDASGPTGTGVSRCPNCRDSYPIVYLENPRRTRTGVRVSATRHDSGPVDDIGDAPPQTGWGGGATDRYVRHVPADYGDDLARAERDADRDARALRLAEHRDRIAQARRQIERSVAQTSGVAVHRGTPSAPSPGPVTRPAPKPATPATPARLSAD